MHTPSDDLFQTDRIDLGSSASQDLIVSLVPGASLLRGFALSRMVSMLAEINDVTVHAPFRHMSTTRGCRMSVSMSNCGMFGWISDRRGYRYERSDPLTERPWPPLPDTFVELAQRAAHVAGFPRFKPDACLINRYEPGARMGLHQDRNECDFDAPIVSVSLGLPATFLFGGASRADKPQRVPLRHGDVLVWGGPSRLFHHGVAPLAEGSHALLGRQRVNLTLRCAGKPHATGEGNR